MSAFAYDTVRQGIHVYDAPQDLQIRDLYPEYDFKWQIIDT